MPKLALEINRSFYIIGFFILLGLLASFSLVICKINIFFKLSGLVLIFFGLYNSLKIKYIKLGFDGAQWWLEKKDGQIIYVDLDGFSCHWGNISFLVFNKANTRLPIKLMISPNCIGLANYKKLVYLTRCF